MVDDFHGDAPGPGFGEGALVALAYIAVEGFEVELELAEVLGLELVHLQLDSDETVQSAMEEEEVEREVPATDLHRVFGADEAEVAAEFGDETAQITQQTGMKISLGVVLRQAEKLQDVGVFKEFGGLRVNFSQRC